MKTLSQSTKKLSSEELFNALSFVEDCFDRAVTPFLLLKHTGMTVFKGLDEGLDGDSLEIGVLKKNMIGFNVATLAALLPKERVWKSHSIKFVYENVPVNIKIIHSNYEFFKYPDTRFYRFKYFNIPNPFMDYYKVKETIK